MRQAAGDGQGWPSVPVAMDGEKGPTAEVFGCTYATRNLYFRTW
ncbi:hypothetical protein DSOL_0612 [Desulfosporosinus metallidurans]|uniref:Uncharacterized protein n=1 Tax=Desulfosporosinus metallidurans TaxID=1888891 RepID=A0A1Q8R1C3_9FIRM|nr:hypothetical protein DSOL_0612 [Desulfosporosinus metallidurans]